MDRLRRRADKRVMRIMQTQGVQDMHGCASGRDAGWSMITAGHVRLGQTRQSDGSSESVDTEDGGGIDDGDIGA